MIADNQLRDLLNRCAHNERRSQKELYQHLRMEALNVSYRYEDKTELIETIVNDAFIWLFRNIGQFERNQATNVYSALKSWFRRIVVMTCVEHYQHQIESRRGQIFPDEKQVINSHPEKKADDYTGQQIIESIRSLPALYRMIFNLHIIEGISHEEIARLLHLTSAMAGSLVLKSREQFRKNLASTVGPVLAGDMGPVDSPGER